MNVSQIEKSGSVQFGSADVGVIRGKQAEEVAGGVMGGIPGLVLAVWAVGGLSGQ